MAEARSSTKLKHLSLCVWKVLSTNRMLKFHVSSRICRCINVSCIATEKFEFGVFDANSVPQNMEIVSVTS